MQPAHIDVSVNGVAHTIPGNQSVLNLLELLDVPVDRVAVELNKSIVRKRDWPTTTVPAKSFIEIVEFVGGG